AGCNRRGIRRQPAPDKGRAGKACPHRRPRKEKRFGPARLWAGPALPRNIAMTQYPDVLATIGNTPLIRLNRVSDATGCEILGKAEFLNPGQSVKDRAALFIIRDAVAKGLLKPGGTIVEG